MPLDSTSIIKITVKKWLYLLNALSVFDGTLKTEKTNFLTSALVRKVSQILKSNFEQSKCK